MSLITNQQREQLIRNGQPSERGKDHIPVVKLFLPGSNCTWLLTEIEQVNPDIAFGLCDLGLGYPELGYVDLEELASVKSRLGLRVERDLYFEGRYPLGVYAEAARYTQQITEVDAILEQFVR